MCVCANPNPWDENTTEENLAGKTHAEKHSSSQELSSSDSR